MGDTLAYAAWDKIRREDEISGQSRLLPQDSDQYGDAPSDEYRQRWIAWYKGKRDAALANPADPSVKMPDINPLMGRMGTGGALGPEAPDIGPGIESSQASVCWMSAMPKSSLLGGTRFRSKSRTACSPMT